MSLIDALDEVRAIRAQGDFESAERILASFMTDNNSFTDRWTVFSVLYTFAVGEGILNKAYDYALRLVEMDAMDPFANSCVGHVHAFRNEWTDAYTRCQCAMDLALKSNDPNYFSYVTDVANILYHQSHIDDCLSLLLSDWDANTDPPKSASRSAIINRLLLLGRAERIALNYQSAIRYYRLAYRNILSMGEVAACCKHILEELVATMTEYERMKQIEY